MPIFSSLGAYCCHLLAGDKFYVPVLGTQIEEVFSTHDTWSTQALRDRMVRLHGIGVLQNTAACLLVLNDRRMTPEKLQDLTFCRQLTNGILFAAAHCSWFEIAACRCVNSACVSMCQTQGSDFLLPNSYFDFVLVFNLLSAALQVSIAKHAVIVGPTEPQSKTLLVLLGLCNVYYLGG